MKSPGSEWKLVAEYILENNFKFGINEPSFTEG